MNVLVIDVGGSHVKFLAKGQAHPREFESGPDLTPDKMVERGREMTADWNYTAIALGIPGRVDAKGPAEEPGNLGTGWVGFDYAKALGCPVRVVNDAGMQALGGYDGGRMLFLGLGTGLGSALVVERVVIPLELGCLYSEHPGETLFDRLGKDGLARNGPDAWQADVDSAVRALRLSLAADYVLLGGGNAAQVDPLPPDTRRGGNEDAFVGGFRLWEEWVEPHDQAPSLAWRVVR